jgi:ABC-type transport system substrate-binding protein
MKTCWWHKLTKTCLAAAFLALLISILIGDVGCGRRAEPPAFSTATIVLEASPNTLDPVAVLDVHSQLLATSVHSPLAWVAPDGHLRYTVAERIDVTPDGLSLDIRLRPEARFWDGSPVRAKDVHYSIERFRRSAHPHRWICDRIVGVEAFDAQATNHMAGIIIQDELNLKLRFSKPEPDAAWLLSSLATAIVKEGNANDTEKPFGSHIIGCGPFRPVDLKPGDLFIVARNAGYPASNRIEQIRFVVTQDTQARLQMARENKADLVRLRGPMLAEVSERVEGNQLQLKSEYSHHVIVTSEANELTFLLLNWKAPVLDGLSGNQRRQWHQALSDAMNRAEMVKNLYQGEGGAEPTHHIAPPSSFTIAPAVAKGTTAVKIPVPSKLTLVSPNDATSRQLATYVQIRSREAGLELEVQLVELPNLIQRVIDRNFEIALLWIEQQIVSTGPFAWISFYNPKSPLSAFGEPLSEIGQQAEEVRGIINSQTRATRYSQLVEGIDIAQTSWVPLASRKAVFLTSKGISIFLDRNGTPVTGFIGIRE